MPSCPGLFLVLSCLSRDSTSAGEVVMVCKVEVISGVVWIGGVVGGLSATECSLCWMKMLLLLLLLLLLLSVCLSFNPVPIQGVPKSTFNQCTNAPWITKARLSFLLSIILLCCVVREESMRSRWLNWCWHMTKLPLFLYLCSGIFYTGQTLYNHTTTSSIYKTVPRQCNHGNRAPSANGWRELHNSVSISEINNDVALISSTMYSLLYCLVCFI